MHISKEPWVLLQALNFMYQDNRAARLALFGFQTLEAHELADIFQIYNQFQAEPSRFDWLELPLSVTDLDELNRLISYVWKIRAFLQMQYDNAFLPTSLSDDIERLIKFEDEQGEEVKRQTLTYIDRLNADQHGSSSPHYWAMA